LVKALFPPRLHSSSSERGSEISSVRLFAFPPLVSLDATNAVVFLDDYSIWTLLSVPPPGRRPFPVLAPSEEDDGGRFFPPLPASPSALYYLALIRDMAGDDDNDAKRPSRH